MKKDQSNTPSHLPNGSAELQKQTEHTHSIKLPASISGQLGMVVEKIGYTPNQVVIQNMKLLQAVLFLVEQSRKGEMGDVAVWNFKEACKRHGIKSEELISGYYAAYSDPYTPGDGIEFRHIWKHIKQGRDNPTPQYLNTRL